jgi:hypothetical protein
MMGILEIAVTTDHQQGNFRYLESLFAVCPTSFRFACLPQAGQNFAGLPCGQKIRWNREEISPS